MVLSKTCLVNVRVAHAILLSIGRIISLVTDSDTTHLGSVISNNIAVNHVSTAQMVRCHTNFAVGPSSHRARQPMFGPDCLGRALADDHAGCHRVPAGDSGHYGSIGDAQVFDSVDL